MISFFTHPNCLKLHHNIFPAKNASSINTESSHMIQQGINLSVHIVLVQFKMISAVVAV